MTVRFSANITKEGQERTGPRFPISQTSRLMRDIEVQRDGQEVIRRGNFFYFFSGSSFYFVQKIIINLLIFLFSAKISHWEIITNNVG